MASLVHYNLKDQEKLLEAHTQSITTIAMIGNADFANAMVLFHIHVNIPHREYFYGNHASILLNIFFFHS